MSASMKTLYDQNPCIAGLGVDCVSRSADDTEIIHWSLAQGGLLKSSYNSAKVQAIMPKPYLGLRPWKEWFSDFIEDMQCNGWSKVEATPHLARCLRGGPGRFAVTQWKDKYQGCGNFDQLVECASYLAGSIGRSDPMSDFRKRVQLPNETPRMYGLDLHNLLHLARPRVSVDEDYFLEELFVHYVEGLRCSEDQKVAYDAWKQDTSLADIFIAIDTAAKKRGLMAGRIPARISAYNAETYSDDASDSDSEDENIGAVNFKRNSNRRFTGKRDSRKEYPG